MYKKIIFIFCSFFTLLSINAQQKLSYGNIPYGSSIGEIKKIYSPLYKNKYNEDLSHRIYPDHGWTEKIKKYFAELKNPHIYLIFHGGNGEEPCLYFSNITGESKLFMMEKSFTAEGASEIEIFNEMKKSISNTVGFSPVVEDDIAKYGYDNYKPHNVKLAKWKTKDQTIFLTSSPLGGSCDVYYVSDKYFDEFCQYNKTCREDQTKEKDTQKQNNLKKLSNGF